MNKGKVLSSDIVAQSKEMTLSHIVNNMDGLGGEYICMVNTHSLVLAHENTDFQNVHSKAYMLLPDGQPIANYLKKNKFPEAEKYSGLDLLKDLLPILDKGKMEIFLYGNTEEVGSLFTSEIQKNYPGIQTNYLPSVFRDLTQEEERDLVHRINSTESKIVFVSLGCPKQEYLSNKLASQTNALWIAIGGAVTIYSGLIPQAPQWMRDHSLEWFYRLIKEPRRLFKRYFVNNTKYLYYIWRK